MCQWSKAYWHTRKPYSVATTHYLLACLLQSKTKGKQGGVSHYGLAIYLHSKVSEGKRRIMETQIVHHASI